MVIDFGLIKELCRDLRDGWDHALLLPPSLVGKYRNTPSQKIVEMPGNPTAELMAAVLYGAIEKALKEIPASNGLRIEKVRVQETETGYAEFEGHTDVPSE